MKGQKMIEFSSVPAELSRFTTRVIGQGALKRGWKVWLYYAGSSQLRLQRPDGKQIEMYSTTPPTTSYVNANRSSDKYFTHLLLEAAGLPVPETYLVTSEVAAQEKAEKMFAEGKQCVVKPLDAGHGNGITVEVTAGMLADAFTYARAFSSNIIIQEQIAAAVDIRLTCIDYTFAAALVRIPARVKGDGEHTIEQLIDIENAKEHRGLNYTKEMNEINKQRAQMYLGDVFQTVPPTGTWIQVIGTANVGTGGETVDVTDLLPKWLIEHAEHAARVAQLPVAGIDFLLDAMPAVDASEQMLQPRIIELNQCPSLFIHEYPIHGSPQPVVSKLLDYLETL
jgi:cyanophycin synthetase